MQNSVVPEVLCYNEECAVDVRTLVTHHIQLTSMVGTLNLVLLITPLIELIVQNSVVPEI